MIHYHVTLPTAFRSSKWSPPFMFSYQNFLYISHLAHGYYIPCPSRPWFDHSDNIWWIVQVNETPHYAVFSSLPLLFSPCSLSLCNILLNFIHSDYKMLGFCFLPVMEIPLNAVHAIPVLVTAEQQTNSQEVNKITKYVNSDEV